MKPEGTGFDFDDTLPIESMDGNRLEIRATDIRLKSYIRAFAVFAIFLAVLVFCISKDREFQFGAFAVFTAGLLTLKFVPREITPILVFVRGSREIRLRRGSLERTLELLPDPFEVHTVGGRGPRVRAIRIHCRDRKGAQIWCKGFPPVDQVVTVAAFLDAFIHGEDPPSQRHVSRIKTD
jgi:hypothetical protein